MQALTDYMTGAIPHAQTFAHVRCPNGHEDLSMPLRLKAYRPAGDGETPLAPFKSACPAEGCDLEALVTPKGRVVEIATRPDSN